MPARPTASSSPRRPALTLKPPAEIDPHEDIHQERIFTMVALYVHRMPELAALFHVPNGGYRHKAEAAALTRRGVKPGVCDLWLPIPRGGWAGLVIELKRFRSGQPTPEQKAWLELLAAAGWKAVLCRGWRAAWREIWRYVHLPPSHTLTHLGGSPTTRKDTDTQL